MGTTSYNIEDVITLPTLEKEGWNFLYFEVSEIDETTNFVMSEHFQEATIPAGRYGDVEFTAIWSANEFGVSFNLTHLTYSADSLTATSGVPYTATLIADEGYALPTSVQVSINGKIVESGYSYTDGVITISGNAVVGNIIITASGTPERFMVTLNLNDARLSHGSTNASVSLEGVQVNENGEIELLSLIHI